MRTHKIVVLYLILLVLFSALTISVSSAQKVTQADSIVAPEPEKQPISDSFNQRISQMSRENSENKISFDKRLQLANKIIKYDYVVILFAGLFIGISTRKKARNYCSPKS